VQRESSVYVCLLCCSVCVCVCAREFVCMCEYDALTTESAPGKESSMCMHVCGCSWPKSLVCVTRFVIA